MGRPLHPGQRGEPGAGQDEVESPGKAEDGDNQYRSARHRQRAQCGADRPGQGRASKEAGGHENGHGRGQRREGRHQGDEDAETEHLVGQPARHLVIERLRSGGAQQLGQHPGSGRVCQQTAPVAAGQGVVGQRDAEVDDHGGQPGPAGAEGTGQSVHARRPRGDRAQHQELLQQTHGARRHRARQAQQGEGERGGSLRPQPRRPPSAGEEAEQG